MLHRGTWGRRPLVVPVIPDAEAKAKDVGSLSTLAKPSVAAPRDSPGFPQKVAVGVRTSRALTRRTGNVGARTTLPVPGADATPA